MQVNLYVVALGISAIASAGLAVVAFRRGSVRGSREMGWLMIAGATWAGITVLEAGARGLSDKVFWSVVAYLGSVSAPVLFLLFTLRYTYQDSWLRPGRIAALFILPIFSVGIAATNEWHKYLWPKIDLVDTPLLGTVAIYAHGPWFWVEMIYAYLMLALGVYALLRAAIRYPYPFSQQYRILLVASLAPWLLSLFYAVRPEFLSGVDLTPVTFIWTSILTAWLITRRQLVDLTPVTHEQVLEGLHEGILLLDTSQRVVIANQAACVYLGLGTLRTGVPIDQVLSGWPEALIYFLGSEPIRGELMMPSSPHTWLQLERALLNNSQGLASGSLVTITNISERREVEQQLVEANAALHENEERYRMLVDNQAEGIGIVDAQERFTYANPAAERIFGVAPGGLAGRFLFDFVAPQDRDIVRQQTRRRLQGEKNVYELGIIRQDGSPRMLEISATPQFTPAGRFMATFGILRDVTERKEAELELVATNNALLARQRYLGLLSEITRAALAASDRRSLLQTLADQMGELLGADACYITTWDEERQLTIPEAATGPLRDTYAQETSYPGELTLTRSVMEAGRALVAEDVFNSPLINPNLGTNDMTRSVLALPLMAGGRKLGAALIGFYQYHPFTQEEIALGEQAANQVALALWKSHLLAETEKARSQAEAANRRLEEALAELDRLATVDALTGAYNRRKFDELISNELGRLDRYHHPVSLILFDIDHFKGINDTYGHHVGDGILVEMVHIVQINLRETDSLIRWGGDEFIILAPGIQQTQAIALAEKIRRLVAELHFGIVGCLTISLGVTALLPGDNADDGVRRADRALYIAKRSGRNRVATGGLERVG